MAVLRNQRTYPLALKSDPLNVGIVAAYDWAAEDDSTTASNGKDHSGNNRDLTITGAPIVVQTADGKARDTSAGGTALGSYRATGAVGVGLNVGTGDFTIYRRLRMPTTMPASNASGRKIFRLTDSAGEKILIQLGSAGSVGWRVTVIISAATALAWNEAGNPNLLPSAIVSIHVTRISGTVRIYINGALVKTITGNTTDLLSTTGSSVTIIGNQTAGDEFLDAAILDDIYWNRGLSGTEVAAHAPNPYVYYENQAPANAVTISQPTAGATAGTSFTVAGTYSGGDSPGAIEASFNGGAWAVIDAAPANGSYSGTLSGQAAGTGTLSVRWASKPEVTASVANVTVAVAGIAFTAPSRPQSAVPYRMFQRDAQNRAAVRVSGTYTGTPTAIQYRWNGSAWATLDAAPTGGVFDKTVTLQGPEQGDLEVRFANATGVTASLPKIGVGDVFLVTGQSNNVGMASVFVEPQPPSAHPGWLAVKCGKDGVWRQHRETSANPFDDRTNALYPIQANAAEPMGSYFGALATKIMATGVPVAFVPCALGSSSLAMWAINTGTDWLYGAALARSADVGDYRAVIWWQGEAECTGTATKAELVSAYGSRVNDWFSRTGKKWFIWAINDTADPANYENVHGALLEVGQTNPNCAGWADLKGTFTGSIHYQTGSEIAEIANRTFAALDTAYEYSATPPSTVSGVTVTPATATVQGGATLQLSAVVAGTNSPSQAVTWTRSPAAGSVSETGLLTAPAATDAVQTITVTATSQQDGTKSGSATITVPAAAAPSSLTVSLTLRDETGPLANLSGLMVAFYAASGPHQAGTALYQSSTETTDGAGVLSFSFNSSDIAPGNTGLVVILATNGRNFNGLVEVT